MELYRNVSNGVVRFPVPSDYPSYALYITSPGYPATSMYPIGEQLTYVIPQVGYLEVEVPYKHTKYDGRIEILAKFDLDGESHEIVRDYAVVTPLFTADEFTADDLTSLNITAADLMELERFIRHIIEAYTGQSFGMTKQSYDINSNTKSINFNVPLIMYTGSGPRFATGSMTTTDSVAYEVIDNGFGIKFNWQDTQHHHIKTDTAFLFGGGANRMRWTLTGDFGYQSVPQDVKEAARALIGLFNCDQTLWRDRYIENLRNADGSTIKYNEGAYIGTGSVAADQLLSKYVRGEYAAAVI